MNPTLSVVVMAFNEAGNLEEFVREVESTAARAGGPCEIIIVDDGSTDGTGELAEAVSRRNKDVKVFHHPANRGLGEVYTTGFEKASGDYVTFFPADGQFPAGIIEDFLPRMKDADMVLGYIPGRKSSVLARSLSALEKILFGFLFGSLPAFQGIMMFRRSLLKDLELKSPGGRGWAVLMELVIRAKRKGYRIISVPTAMRQRSSGRSKVNNLKTVLANLRQAIALKRYL